MKIVIPGGSGMIGTALTEALTKDGHTVVVLSRSVKDICLMQGAQAAQWDGKTSQGWLDQLDGADAVINLAGANIGDRRWTEARKQDIRDSRKHAGQAIVEALQKVERRPGVLLQMAGTGYYGPGDQPVTEDSPLGGDFQASVAKDWEASTAPAEALGIRRVVMRTGVVLTRRGGVLSPFLLQHRLFAGGPLGSGKQWISWIHMQDLIRAMRFFLDRQDAYGIYNVTSPEPVTNATFERTVGRVMRRPYWIPVPAFALRIVLGEKSLLVLEGHRALPAKLLAMGFIFQYPSLQKALENLLQRTV